VNGVLHILDHSLPEHYGYSFRSHSILMQVARSGFDKNGTFLRLARNAKVAAIAY
jgi:hypothetical protein